MPVDLDALSREVADPVRLALAALKANPPHHQSPLPWQRKWPSDVAAADGTMVVDFAMVADAAHIAAAVNAAPVLAAEVDRLTAQLEAARVAVEKVLAVHTRDCASHGYVTLTPITKWECDCAARFVAEARRAVGLEG